MIQLQRVVFKRTGQPVTGMDLIYSIIPSTCSLHVGILKSVRNLNYFREKQLLRSYEGDLIDLHLPAALDLGSFNMCRS